MSGQDGNPVGDRFGATAPERPGARTLRPLVHFTCLRCGFPISSRPMGCKNPCRNCGTVYPLGDCSD